MYRRFFLLWLALAPLAMAQTVVTPSLQACYPVGNGKNLSSNGCLCSGNLDCIGVCPISSGGAPCYCAGGPSVPVCAPGNTLELSADGCACASNLECAGVCPFGPNPRVCAGGGTAAAQPACLIPGSGGNANPNGCPCDGAGDCQGTCNTQTRTCGGVIGAVANEAINFSALASGDIELGGAIVDEATVMANVDAPASVRFQLFGPGDTNCANVLRNAVIAIPGNGSTLSPPVIPGSTGTHRWIASYLGNAWNLPAATACGDPNQSVVVLPTLFRNGFE